MILKPYRYRRRKLLRRIPGYPLHKIFGPYLLIYPHPAAD